MTGSWVSGIDAKQLRVLSKDLRNFFSILPTFRALHIHEENRFWRSALSSLSSIALSCCHRVLTLLFPAPTLPAAPHCT